MNKMKQVRSYVITTYIVFWAMVLGICGTASMVFHVPPLVMRLLSNLCAWSPTIVLLARFKTLMGETTVKEFLKKQFGGKLKLSVCLLIIVVISGAVIISALITSLISQRTDRFFELSYGAGAYPIWLSALLSVTSGPTGEELGWRGYLRTRLEEQYSFLRACIYQGVIWAFWHLVLWFVDSEFTGLSMIPYIISNVVVMTSLAVIMSLILRRYNNLFYAVLIHFCFNFTYCFFTAGIGFYIVISVVYAIAAAVFYAAYRIKGSEKYKLC